MKEISAHLLRRPVGAGYRVALQRGQRFRDEDLLQLLGAFEFLLQSTLALALLHRIAIDRVHDRDQEKGEFQRMYRRDAEKSKQRVGFREMVQWVKRWP